MDYLKDMLGIRVRYIEDETPEVSEYLNALYRFQPVLLDDVKAYFVFPKIKLRPIGEVKDHVKSIEKVLGKPVVLVVDFFCSQQKKYLCYHKIPFIVLDRQIYLPFMGIYLQNKENNNEIIFDMFLPSSQLMLLYYIYLGCPEMYTSEFLGVMPFNSTTVSRASRQLEQLGFIEAERRGKNKAIFTDKTPKELFESLKSKLMNPVKRTVYVKKEDLKDDLMLSGYSALADYTSVSFPPAECYASDKVKYWSKYELEELDNATDLIAVEIWRYDPNILSDGKSVDRLSLALSLRDDEDPEVQKAVETMLDQLWEEIDAGHPSELQDKFNLRIDAIPMF